MEPYPELRLSILNEILFYQNIDYLGNRYSPLIIPILYSFFK